MEEAQEAGEVAPTTPVEPVKPEAVSEPVSEPEASPEAPAEPESTTEAVEEAETTEDTPWEAETRERLSAVLAAEGAKVEMDEAAGTATITQADGFTTTYHMNADAKLAAIAKKRGLKNVKGVFVWRGDTDGEFQKGHIYVRSDANHEDMNHEMLHALERAGKITPAEVAKFGGRESMARKYGKWAASKQRKPNAVFQRIFDFMEQIFSSSARLFKDIGKRGAQQETAASAVTPTVATTETPAAPADRSGMTVKELKAEAKSLGLTRYSGKNKAAAGELTSRRVSRNGRPRIAVVKDGVWYWTDLLY